MADQNTRKPDEDPVLEDLRAGNRRAMEVAAMRGYKTNPRIAEAIASGRLR
jgi:hypothetical protein